MSQTDVVIVGAGAAGIAAARRLLAAGLQVRVLEARARPGGRAWTDNSLGAAADMGAAWLHFADRNAFTTLAEESGLTIIRREPNWGPEAYIGQRAPTAAERSALATDYARYEARIEAAADAGRDVSLATILPQDHYRARFDAIMTWAVGVETAQVSTLDLTAYADSRPNWAVAEGLGTVVAQAARSLPISFNATVTSIDWNSDSVAVHCSSGTVNARTVIVTVPPSVLAEGSISFHPALPATHRLALESLRLGVVNKVFFRMPEQHLPFAAMTHLIGRSDTSRTANYIVRPAGQPLLCAFFGGDLSRELEQRGELEAFAREQLRDIFGAELLRHIDASLTTGWGNDPYARGSYSAALPGHAHCRRDLAAPVSTSLMFAGEACSVAHYGTVHGAWLSGVAAANHCIAAYA